jgi:hypothetical protein
MKERPMREIKTAEPAGYAEFLAELKQRIERAQLRCSSTIIFQEEERQDLLALKLNC